MGTPEIQELQLELVPDRFGCFQQPRSVGNRIVAHVALPPIMREIGEVKVTDERTDVEPHRPAESELRIDDKGLALVAHDRADMEVAVDQRLRARHERVLHLADGRPHLGVLLNGFDRLPRKFRIVVVGVGIVVGVGEDEVLGDLAELDVDGAPDRLLLRLGAKIKVGRVKQRLREVRRHVIGEQGKSPTLNHLAAQDAMLAEVLHDDERHVARCEVDLGDVLRAEFTVCPQRRNLEVHAVARQRPRFTNDAEERHSLLDRHRLVGVGAVRDDVDEVEVAVADFIDLKIIERREPPSHLGQGAEIGGHTRFGQLPIGHLEPHIACVCGGAIAHPQRRSTLSAGSGDTSVTD